ncbi:MULTISPECIES: respiratory nitrate reductase subunit gamma [unclassified Streptomyces]|uniref:respiratory nitrate reductase subunit gamma n=1 Tax=unclassified Streptomyces TaxID=2593676 RepID=UPI00369D77AB
MAEAARENADVPQPAPPGGWVQRPSRPCVPAPAPVCRRRRPPGPAPVCLSRRRPPAPASAPGQGRIPPQGAARSAGAGIVAIHAMAFPGQGPGAHPKGRQVREGAERWPGRRSRRRTVGPVFSATTRNDKAMYVSLTATLALGLAATVDANIAGGGHNYRETVSPWFRSVFAVQPDPHLMSGAPLLYRLHAISAMLLFAAWPFTRLVHMLTAPIGYLTRPYIVYRSRDTRLGTRAPRRGWERLG